MLETCREDIWAGLTSRGSYWPKLDNVNIKINSITTLTKIVTLVHTITKKYMSKQINVEDRHSLYYIMLTNKCRWSDGVRIIPMWKSTLQIINSGKYHQCLEGESLKSKKIFVSFRIIPTQGKISNFWVEKLYRQNLEQLINTECHLVYYTVRKKVPLFLLKSHYLSLKWGNIR